MSKKICIITGAGSGIGKASALELLKNNFIVIISGRNLSKLEDVKKEALENSTNCYLHEVDVSDYESVKKLFSFVIKKFNRLDILFNNAGISAPAVSIEDLPIENWHSVVNTNLNGMLYCIKEAFKIMKEQMPNGGRIINNGSVSAYAPRPNSFAYTATKHAVTGLTKSASLDGRKYNIACSQIDIGNALTDLAAKFKDGVPQADGSIKSESVMDVIHVANAIVQIAQQPLDVNTQFMTIMATKMPYIGRG
jgi:NADP-dependent 3-hydroxy acid dehydrogenase YdfG